MSSTSKNTPVLMAGLEARDLEKTIAQIWQDVHDGIDPARQEAYKLTAYWNLHNLFEKSYLHRIRSSLTRQKTPAPPQPPPPSESRRSPEDEAQELESALHKTSLDKPDELEKYAGLMEEIARSLQRDTEKIRIESTERVSTLLLITSRAGRLLNYTERILLAYERQLEAGLKPRVDEILSASLTIVATARDQLHAAEAQTKNIKARIGRFESKRLIRYYLIPLAFAYIIFHPYWFPSYWFKLSYPAWVRTYWEIVFYAFFGAISISIVTINEDTMKDEFDPRHLEKYRYRIAVAPFVSVVIILFLSIVPLASNSSASGTLVSSLIDLTSPNIPLIIALAYVLGFFSKRSIDVLDQIWRRVFGTDQ